MNFLKLKNKSHYIKKATNTGVYILSDNNCLLIDSSYPGKEANKLLNTLKEKKLNVKYIINTHGHIDHFGGNELLAEHFSLEVFASPYEKSFISYPDLSHSFLTSAKAMPSLRTNLKGLEVREIKNNEMKLDDNIFEIIELAGHSRGHIGVLSEDGVLYAGDALLAPSLIDQIKIPYFYDIEEFKKSLYKIKTLVEKKKIKTIVPSHGDVITENFDKSIEKNINKVQSLLENLVDILSEKALSMEKIILHYNEKFNIKDGLANYFITRACTMAFLSYLIEKNKVETIFKNNILHYKLI